MRSPFDDPVLYDWEYRRRRDDVRFYRTLADERGGPVLDVGCGTGRLMIPLVRDGHVVVGLDASAAMLGRAANRVLRLRPELRRRAALLRADMRALPVRRRFAFAVAAFHTIQHCESDADLIRFCRGVRRALLPGGWFAFDTFAPTPQFVARSGWSGATRFRHPRTAAMTQYRERHALEQTGRARVLEMTFRYESARNDGRPRTERAQLRHRLLSRPEVERALRSAGLSLIAAWSGFDGAPLDDESAPSEQQVYLTRRNNRGTGSQNPRKSR